MPVSRFLQIRERLWADITANAFGDKLPPEPDLAKRYEVSRMTLRRAIAGLTAEGFLTAQQGRGTFVVRDRIAPSNTKTIGLIIDPRVIEGHADPYFGTMIGTLASHLSKSGYSLVFAGAAEELVPLTPGSGQRRPVSGIIAMGFDRDSVWNVASTRVPVVLIDSYPLPDRTCVIPDNRDGIRQAVRHLTALGHKRIGHIAGPLATVAAQERLQAWRESLVSVGLTAPDELTDVGWFTAPGGGEALEKLLAAPGGAPTAIICANDRMALGALRKAREKGLRVPQDLSIIGFDNIDAGDLSDPGLTTLAVPREAMVAAAFEALVTEMEQADNAPRQTVRLPVELVVRGTTGRV